jgi:hypothetical protein
MSASGRQGQAAISVWISSQTATFVAVLAPDTSASSGSRGRIDTGRNTFTGQSVICPLCSWGNMDIYFARSRVHPSTDREVS